MTFSQPQHGNGMAVGSCHLLVGFGLRRQGCQPQKVEAEKNIGPWRRGGTSLLGRASPTGLHSQGLRLEGSCLISQSCPVHRLRNRHVVCFVHSLSSVLGEPSEAQGKDVHHPLTC